MYLHHYSGKTVPKQGVDDTDLFIDTLVNDLLLLLTTLFPDPAQAPSLVVSTAII